MRELLDGGSDRRDVIVLKMGGCSAHQRRPDEACVSRIVFDEKKPQGDIRVRYGARRQCVLLLTVVVQPYATTVSNSDALEGIDLMEAWLVPRARGSWRPIRTAAAASRFRKQLGEHAAWPARLDDERTA